MLQLDDGKLVIPEGTEIVRKNMLSPYNKKSEIVFPSSLCVIDDAAFDRFCNVTKIVVPNSVHTISNSAFSLCAELKQVVLPSEVDFFGECMFRMSAKLEEVTLPENLQEIPVSTFNGCKKLKSVNIPKGVEKIQSAAFTMCKSLESIDFPSSLKLIYDNSFSWCSSLKEAVFKEGLLKIGQVAFSGCASLYNVELPDTLFYLGNSAFEGCSSLRNVKLSKNLTKILENTFANCISLKEVDLRNVTYIGENAFSRCSSLEKVVFSENLQKVEEKAFEYSNFKYVYKVKGTNNIVFDIAIPKHTKIEKIIDLEKLKKSIPAFDVGVLATNESFENFSELIQRLDNAQMVLSYSFVEEMLKRGRGEELKKNFNYRFLPKEYPLLMKELREVNSLSTVKTEGVLRLANALGCFSNEKIIDNNGRETSTLLAQKATSTLVSLMRNKDFYQFAELFLKDLSVNIKPNQDFLKFISVKDGDKFVNFELLVDLDSKYSGLFKRVISDFDGVKSMRKGVDKNGKPYTLSWAAALDKFNLATAYKNVTSENEDISSLFVKHGLDQESFDKASRLRREAIEKNVPAHILGHELKEETIITRIEKIKNDTSNQLYNSASLIESLYDEMFSYEMLDKHDAKNAIIGLYTNCCATITSTYYGKEIAAATMRSHEVQNLIVRNVKGEIVAKGAIYVNKKDGYAVINEFELNEAYRKHEFEGTGYYQTQNYAEEQERQKIFETFQRGVRAFAAAYDKQNPDNPLQIVTVGMGYNRLKKQCDALEEVAFPFKVPIEYSFDDVVNTQKIMYINENANIEIKNDQKDAKIIEFDIDRQG